MISPIVLLSTVPILIMLFVLSLRWVYRDARRRSFDGRLAVALVLLSVWPLSLCVWLFVRSGHTLNSEGGGAGSGGWG